MTETRFVAGVACCWLGAWAGGSHVRPIQLLGLLFLAGLLLLVSLWRDSAPRRFNRQISLRTTAAIVGLATVAAAAAMRADDVYVPLPAGAFRANAEVLSLPERSTQAGWRVELRFEEGSRVEARAWGAAADALVRAKPGDHIEVVGRMQEMGERPWLRTRHIVGRASLDDVELKPELEVSFINRLVTVIQTRVEAGSNYVDRSHQGLYLGLVLGDDRNQPLGQRLRFREAGLSHLLAVSGQNVAFVLAVFSPVLVRMGSRARLLTTLALLVIFALVTRLEPSVLRASATAAVACWARWSERASTGLAVLSTAVVGLIMVDPFLVGSVGFQLSVAASMGILLLSPAVAKRVRGPSVLRESVAVTVGAQIGVSPILGLHFGMPSLVALPANLAAGWAAGLLMPWGLTGGVLAGLLPQWWGQLLQMPADLLLWWLDHLASWAAALPAPRPGPLPLLLVAALVIAAGATRRWSRAGCLVAVAALLTISFPVAPSVATECGPGARWLPAADGRDSASILVLSGSARASTIESCRRHGIRHVDVLIVTSSSRSSAEVAQALRNLVAIEWTLAPPDHGVQGAYRVTTPIEVEHGWGLVKIEPDSQGRGLMVSGVGVNG